jgi:hypothetical protein
MAQVTSAIAAKRLRKLNDERDALLTMGQKSRTFTAAIQEDVESVRPAYDYTATQEMLTELEGKIRRLKHAINCFNCTHVLPEFDMTIDQMLVYLPQLTARMNKLDQMRSKLPRERVKESFNRGSNIIDYDYANYDIAQAKADYDIVADKLARAQNALDLANTTVLFEIDLE